MNGILISLEIVLAENKDLIVLELGRYRGVVSEYYLKDNSEYFEEESTKNTF